MHTSIQQPQSMEALSPDCTQRSVPEAPSSFFFFFFSQCCMPWTLCSEKSTPPKLGTCDRTAYSVEQKQPALTPSPFVSAPACDIREVGVGAYITRKPPGLNCGTADMLSALAAWRKRQRERRSGTNRSVRSLQISAPTNFRHVASQSFSTTSGGIVDVQAFDQRDSQLSFHLLELSIHQASQRLSPILSHFQLSQSAASSQLSLHDTEDTKWDIYNGSPSRTLSFHLPRRALCTPQHQFPGAIAEDEEETNTDICQRPHHRSPSCTHIAPQSEMAVERIASAIIERELLERAIEDCIEKESLYFNSRPSTAIPCSRRNEITNTGTPILSVPTLPASVDSFAHRMHGTTDEQLPVHRSSPSPLMSNSLPSSPATPSIRSCVISDSTPAIETITPPLPLVLRPPLRKKRAFSRVSSWLLLKQEPWRQHHRDMSLDSVTNSPRPVTGRDGFYQCFTPPLIKDESLDGESIESVLDWDSGDDEQVLQTTQAWSVHHASRKARKHKEDSTPSANESSRSSFASSELIVPVVGVAF
ncbi:hypothetical protein CFIMG_003243RAa1 [Ceratocystis fimbriata CBS 114723]|uniref:Uncharacterized protein n=1 Tax=Ceratocystis fimbriata CBS 114723 TaxID=1035309 RepID=A0A2C5WS13_9PEZI|nr:hypothetical protein CFIMG_003243RAa1 [Ceratocystis fimbriata CBS 114723]